jgi:hypothetical protein
MPLAIALGALATVFKCGTSGATLITMTAMPMTKTSSFILLDFVFLLFETG